jgi:hypothetical protein
MEVIHVQKGKESADDFFYGLIFRKQKPKPKKKNRLVGFKKTKEEKRRGEEQ